MSKFRVAIVGGGLAGCECALYLARAGVAVTLLEQKPLVFSPAHTAPGLAELVCSNSFRSDELTSGVGLLKQELRDLGSALMWAADDSRIPAGKALAVDRRVFSRKVSGMIEREPGIRLERHVVRSLDESELALRSEGVEDDSVPGYDRIVIAAGPLAGEELSASLAEAIGAGHLYFYDAIAPIVSAESVNLNIAFWGTRYGEPGAGDYLNCPMDEAQYRTFYDALLRADKATGHGFEKELHFEGCMPIEALAARGERTLLFGPLKPVGLTNPHTGTRPYAVLQLRPENSNGSMCNLVGCQTKMTYPAQDKVFRLVPGLERADFVRHGSMHRNTYVNAPQTLDGNLELRCRPRVHLAGQITGVEGYVESMACGLWAGMRVHALLNGIPLPPLPPVTALGALMAYLLRPAASFQPSNVHFGLMPESAERIRKKDRKIWYVGRARAAFAQWLADAASFLPS